MDEEDEACVFVTCNKDRHKFVINDIGPEFLQEVFDLSEAPTILFSCDSNMAIPIAKKAKRLKPGESYYIKAKSKVDKPSLDVLDSYDNKNSNVEHPGENLEQIILNAIIASTAIYYPSDEGSHTNGGECQTFLTDQLDNHNFRYIVRSRFGETHYLIAKELDVDRIYIAFRGTRDLNDWKYNLQVFRERCGSAIRGKFHSGFLQRALKFPMEKILNDDNFKSSDVVVCGHSLGGAIASIVTIRLQMEKSRRKLKGDVRCVTFGAPLYGDEELAKFLETNNPSLNIVASNMYNFVSTNDPVPKLLSYTQSLSSFSNSLDSQISALASTFGSTEEGTSYHRRNTDKLIAQKDVCMESLSKLVPLVDTMLDITSLVVPQAHWTRTVKNIVSVCSDVSSSSKVSSTHHERNIPKKNVYVPIGNFHFLEETNCSSKYFTYKNRNSIQEHLDFLIMRQELASGQYQESQENAHALSHYEALLRKCQNPSIPFGSYETFQDISTCFGDTVHTMVVQRKVEFKELFKPEIHKAELVKVTTSDYKENILRLTLTGRHLFDVVLERCEFQIGFPFAKREEKVTIKKLSTGENFERLVIEEQEECNVGTLLAISDHGSMLVVATQFGMCEYFLRREHVRDLPIPTVKQIAQHDSVSLVVRKALQRGMAFAQIKREGGLGSGVSRNERIIQEIKELGTIAFGEKEMAQMEKLFDDSSKYIQFILSNEEEFEKVNQFCEKIQLFLKSPMRIEAQKSVAKKIGITMAGLAGGAAVGYVAGPGMVIIGLLGEISATGVAGGVALGGLGVGWSTYAMLNEQLVDSVYENALKWIVQELLIAREGSLSHNKKQEVSDLRDEGSVFSNEKALMLLYNSEEAAQADNCSSSEYSVFQNCSLDGCTDLSKAIVIQRIKAIQKIHRIREIFARQCFIGLVGIQDSGKTTLLKKIWGVGGKTGFFTHTDVPMMYEINNRLFVIDFPGSNSLEYHAKTFSICGAMNNMIILIIPFTGDVSQLVSEEVAKVFSVMKGSDATQVILCINKCGPFLSRVQEELSNKCGEVNEHVMETDADDPSTFLKKRFIEKLNDYYENTGQGIQVNPQDILFTDWHIGDTDTKAVQQFGLSGVEEVKRRIKDYLLKYGIYDQGEEDELIQCVSKINSSI